MKQPILLSYGALQYFLSFWAYSFEENPPLGPESSSTSPRVTGGAGALKTMLILVAGQWNHLGTHTQGSGPTSRGQGQMPGCSQFPLGSKWGLVWKRGPGGECPSEENLATCGPL